MSSRSWLSYYYQNRFHLTPLSYESLEYASGFSSEQCPEGIVAISTNTLRILALEKLGAVFNQVTFCMWFVKNDLSYFRQALFDIFWRQPVEFPYKLYLCLHTSMWYVVRYLRQF